MGLGRRTFLTAAVAHLGCGAPLLGPPSAQAQAALPAEILDFGDYRIVLTRSAGFDPQTQADVVKWIQRGAAAVTAYLGHFPLKELDLRLSAFEGGGVRSGFTSVEDAPVHGRSASPRPSPFVRIRLGSHTSAIQLYSDWVLVHEMVHLAVPRIPRKHNWLHEGLATYVEGVARTRAGIITANLFWGELAAGMPQGLPQDQDRGLDNTPTWGRTYWGGAMFCLLADVQMRQTSNNRVGLQQALQGLHAAGASYALQWPVELVLRTADRAVGQTTLMDLYERMKGSPMPVDLPKLWRDLGVDIAQPDHAIFRSDAPLALVRNAIA